MTREFGGRLDRWLHPSDDAECGYCMEHLDDGWCENDKCGDYIPPVERCDYEVNA